MWYNVFYIIILGASIVASFLSIRSHVMSAWDALSTRNDVAADRLDEIEIKKVRVKSSLWNGARGNVDQFKADESLQKLWCHEELEYAQQKINDCYISMGLAISEDVPMMALNIYMIFYL